MNKSKTTTAVPRKSLLELAEISVLLSSYDDIFSAFDPSEYSEKTLSDDFIIQAKNILRNKIGNKMSLKLLLPENKRNEEKEEVIVKRLHSYFKNIHQQLESEVRKRNQRGWILTVVGVVIMGLASYISFMKPEKYHVHFLLVLFEPGGWFLLWAGLDHLVWSSKETKKDLAFNLRMAKSEIKFFTY